jgi:hypothetical protein
VLPTFTRWGFAAAHPELVTEEENKSFMAILYTIGGMMVFPGNVIDGKWTINPARGCLSKISDRFDLTLEYIRRYYVGQARPLSETLAGTSSRYSRTSAGTWTFSCSRISSPSIARREGLPRFDDFKTPSVPKDVETYGEYRRRIIDFVQARNRRIEGYAAASP